MSAVTVNSGEYVAILDAGSQYGKVIDRRVRELRVETRILPLNTPTAQLRDDPKLKGVIISGGPCSISDADAPEFNEDLFDTIGKPVLGICYGMQLMGRHFGGVVSSGDVREDGQDEVDVDLSSPIFAGLSAKEQVLLTHKDSITEVGDNLIAIARSSANIIAGVQHKTLPHFGVQFHPEVELTVNGVKIFNNFLSFCKCSFDFTPEDRQDVAIKMIQERTSAGQKVLCLASGGVDSTVCAVLLIRAIGAERVVCIHIDHGFMRQNESKDVVQALEAAGVNVTLVDARERFAKAVTTMPAKAGREAYVTAPLCETAEPEEKRTIIGDTFMKICDDVIAELNLDVSNLLLAQGTLRPDLIESGSSYASKNADAIKTHHNDTAVVRKLRDAGRIIEPLCDYHKDEVRELGARLGIPEPLVQRQPFPGPGLAIRTLCARNEPFSDPHLAAADAVVKSICEGKSDSPLLDGLRSAIAAMQPAGCVLPVRTVGVQGDGRTYACAAAISLGRNPTAEEWETLLKLAKVIPKLEHHLNRVVYLFGDKYTTLDTTVTPTLLTTDVLDRLRAADSEVNKLLMEHHLVRALSQVPVVLLPVPFGKSGAHSIVIRTFLTHDFMTGIPATPGGAHLPIAVLETMVENVQKLDFVSRVMFDMTAKPPGTTEWE